MSMTASDLPTIPVVTTKVMQLIDLLRYQRPPLLMVF